MLDVVIGSVVPLIYPISYILANANLILAYLFITSNTNVGVRVCGFFFSRTIKNTFQTNSCNETKSERNETN